MNWRKSRARNLALILVFSLCFSLFHPLVGSASSEGGEGGSEPEATVTQAVYTLEITPNPVVLIPGAEQTFQAIVYDEGGNPVTVSPGDLTWSADSVIGTMNGATLQAVSSVPSGFRYGYVQAEYKGATMKALVLVGRVGEVFEDFESLTYNGKTALSAGKINAASSQIELVARPEPVMYGEHSVKLIYDLRGSATTAAYVSHHNLDTGALDRPIDGDPKRIGVWVYGLNNNHWLRVRLRNASNGYFALDLAASVNWNGWRYMTAEIPDSQARPLKFMDVYIVETSDTKKDTGYIYFDRLSFFYTNTSIFGVDIIGLTPMQVGDAKQAQVLITKANSTAPEPVDSADVIFLSSHPEVATVDSSGVVTAHKAGKTTIVALYADAQPALFELNVTDDAPVVESLHVYGPSELEAGRQGKAEAFAKFKERADKLDVTQEAVWSSTDAAVAEVSAGGLITAKKAGTTDIRASYSGITASYTLTVNPPTPVLHAIHLSNLHSLSVGETLQAKVLAEYYVLDQPYETVEVTDNLTFTSSNTNVATIDANGLIEAKAVGVSLISASYGGKTVYYPLVVHQAEETPKRELRAAWIATVENIDWPKQGVFDPEQQKQDFIELLDNLAEIGINAIIVQIKPTADAFYPSEYAPWSHWLTGEQGKDPGYDPLAFMIEEARKRNMEFHAWFNPYRVSMDTDISKLAEDHVARQHPEWIVPYGGRLYFNPGIPEVRDYITETILEVVRNYDIDAVHFDDYFYPYPSGSDFPDDEEFAKYGQGFINRGDWRRNNVNTFIQTLSEKIKEVKPHVQFGISPFGIWRNKSSDPLGSDTNGLQSYDAIYADTRLWVKQGWIDYIAPQIYWYFNYGPAAYEKLIDWWTKQTEGTNVNLYIGHAAYRVGSEDVNWQDPDQIPNQILYNRSFEGVHGSIFFATNNLLANPLGLKDRLQELFQYPALVPEVKKLDVAKPAAPEQLKAYSLPNGVQLVWNDSSDASAYYVIYRAEGEGQTPDITDAKQIVATVRKLPKAVRQTYTDTTADPSKPYTYVVTAVNRANVESAPSSSAAPVEPNPPVWVNGELQAGSATDTSVTLTWSGASDELGVSGYRIYKDGALLATVPGDTTQYEVTGLEPDTEYVFKVEAGNAADKWSTDGPSVKVKTEQAAPVWENGVLQASDITSTSVKLSWSGASDKTGVTGYRIYKDGELLATVSGDTTEYQVTDLTPNTEYVFKVEAGNAADKWSTDGPSVTVRTKNRPAPPLFPAPDDEDDSQSGDDQPADEQPADEHPVKFTDTSGHWAEKLIERAAELNLVNGYPDGTIRPDSLITRAEFLTLLARALQWQNAGANIQFTDDDQIEDWARQAIAQAVELGVVNGYTDGSFRPNQPITRAEMAVLMARALQVWKDAADTGFADHADIPSWAVGAVQVLRELGIMQGRENNQFAPNANTTRAEAITVILRVWDMLNADQ